MQNQGGHLVTLQVRSVKNKVLMVFSCVCCLAACSPGEQTFIRVASGPAGGYWYPLGAKQAEIFQREIPGISASSGPGGGVGNLMVKRKLAIPMHIVLIVRMLESHLLRKIILTCDILRAYIPPHTMWQYQSPRL